MVSYKLAVEGAAVSVIDKDQGISTMSFSVKYPQKAPDVVNVDSHSKFVVSFSLKNMNTSIFVTVHQVLLLLLLSLLSLLYSTYCPLIQFPYLSRAIISLYCLVLLRPV